MFQGQVSLLSTVIDFSAMDLITKIRSLIYRYCKFSPYLVLSLVLFGCYARNQSNTTCSSLTSLIDTFLKVSILCVCTYL